MAAEVSETRDVLLKLYAFKQALRLLLSHNFYFDAEGELDNVLGRLERDLITQIGRETLQREPL